MLCWLGSNQNLTGPHGQFDFESSQSNQLSSVKTPTHLTNFATAIGESTTGSVLLVTQSLAKHKQDLWQQKASDESRHIQGKPMTGFAMQTRLALSFRGRQAFRVCACCCGSLWQVGKPWHDLYGSQGKSVMVSMEVANDSCPT